MSLEKVIIEKWKKCNYVDVFGCSIWLNRYGETLKIIDKHGGSVFVKKNINKFLEPGYILYPYVSVF